MKHVIIFVVFILLILGLTAYILQTVSKDKYQMANTDLNISKAKCQSFAQGNNVTFREYTNLGSGPINDKYNKQKIDDHAYSGCNFMKAVDGGDKDFIYWKESAETSNKGTSLTLYKQVPLRNKDCTSKSFTWATNPRNRSIDYGLTQDECYKECILDDNCTVAAYKFNENQSAPASQKKWCALYPTCGNKSYSSKYTTLTPEKYSDYMVKKIAGNINIEPKEYSTGNKTHGESCRIGDCNSINTCTIQSGSDRGEKQQEHTETPGCCEYSWCFDMGQSGMSGCVGNCNA